MFLVQSEHIVSLLMANPRSMHTILCGQAAEAGTTTIWLGRLGSCIADFFRHASGKFVSKYWHSRMSQASQYLAL